MVNGALTMPCARMPGMSSPTPTRKPLLPPAALKWLGVAFAIGLLLFLMLWLDQRNDTDFFKGGPASESGEPANLPAPLPPDLAGSDDNASGLRLPRDGDGSALPPPPVAEQPRIIDEPAPPPMLPPQPSAPVASAGPDRAPVPVSRPAPRYPREAERVSAGGTVRVRATVAPDGSVERLELASGSGNRHLDRAAMEAVRRWRFQPALRNGQPVSAEMIVPVEFSPGR